MHALHIQTAHFHFAPNASAEALQGLERAMKVIGRAGAELEPTTPQPAAAHTSLATTAKNDMNNSEIEQEIQAKGKTAPRVTPADIEANIVSEHFFTAQHGVSGAMAALELHQITWHPGGEGVLRLLTFCVLVLRNGFTVTGESACASPENFDAEIGRNVARANAVQKIWPLMGYELRSQLANTMPCTCVPNQGCSNCRPRPVLTEADAQADLDGTPRPDYYTD